MIIFKKLVKIAFNQVDQNIIKFDNNKLELIYLNKLRRLLIAIITLLNDTIL